MTTSAAEPLVTLRRHGVGAPWSADALAALADRLLSAAGAGPLRATTERTVRFYVTRSVVQPPFGRGPGSAWGYAHLVELLAARLGQRDGESLDAIAARRAALDGEALERHVVARLAVPLPPPEEPAPPPAAPIGSAWHRFEVGPGVELQLRDDHPLLRDPRRLAALLDGLRPAAAPTSEDS